MNWRFVHRVWALVWHPRKTTLGVQTLCIALLLIAGTTSPARADCPAAPIANPNDMAISFLVANSVQASSASLLASSVKEGTLVYDDTANELKVCNGTSWVAVGTATGSIAAGAASEVQFRDSGTGAFAADSAFRYDPAAHILTISPNPATLSQAPFTNTVLHLSNVDGSAPRLLMEAFSNGSTTTPNVSMRSANGTGAAPLALRNEDILGQLTFTGHNGTSFATARSAIRGTATEDWTPTANGADLRFHTTPNGTADVIEAMRIANNGNVGIGTATAPIVSAVAGRTSLSIKGASDGGVLELANGSADTDPATVGVIQFSNPNFTPASDVKTRVAAIAVRSTGATVGDRGGVIEFHTKKDGDFLALRMLIDGNGSVGIGTTTPQSVLQVAGGIQLGDDTATCPGASDIKLGTMRFNGGDLQICKSGGWAALGSGGGATPAGNDGSIQFKLGINLAADAANLHWDDTNNRFGVGTATPEFDLDVVAASPAPNAVIAVKGDGTSSYLSTRSYGGTPHFQSIRYGGSLSSPAIVSANDPIMVLAAHGYDGTAVRQNAGIVMSVDGTPGPSDMPGRIAFQTTADGAASPAERMRITSSGNVGIGTTSPANKLDVQGAGTISGRVYSSDSDARQILEAAGTGGRGWFLQTGNNASGLNGRFRIWDNTASAERFAIASNGNVGMGTNNPTQKLHISGSGAVGTQIQGTTYGYLNLLTSNNSAVVGLGDAGSLYLTTYESLPITFHTNSAERLRISETGNVGIGTTTPQSVLQVAGGIQLADDVAACPGASNVKLGTVRYASNVLSVCISTGWTALATGSSGITALTGDVTASGAGSVVATIANNAVTSAKILDGTIATADLANSAVTNAKLANMAANTIKGNNTGSAAAPVDLTMAQLATMLDGTGTFVKKAGDSMTGQLVNTGGLAASQAMATATGSLGAFEARAQGSAGTAGAAFITFHRPSAYAVYFGLDTDSQLKVGGWSMGANAYKIWHENNDGAASGLDADLLDGLDTATAATANTIMARDANGDSAVRYLNSSYVNMSHAAGARNTDTVFYSSNDNYIRKNTAAGFRTALDVYSKGEVDTLAAGDNLGNHTATQALNMGGFAINNAGAITSTGGLVVSAASASQARIKHGNFGVILRNDGTNYYHLLTNSGDADGTWNALRPFTINLSTGAVSMANGLTVTGSVAATTFSGNGAGLTSLNASNLATGTVATARLGSGTANSTTFLRGDGTWTAPPSGADNLGDHTATMTLALGANALTSSAGTVIDGGGGWHRSYGNTGWYNGTYGGGWYMTDATYIRNYNSKPVLLNASLRADAGLNIYNSSPTIYLQDSDQRSAMIHNNANLLYFLSGCGNGDTNWCQQANGYWPLYLNLNNNDAVFGGNVYAFGYFHNSDARLKKQIRTIPDGLDLVSRLRGVSYRWKHDDAAALGVIAQEVEKVVPSAVRTNDKGDKTVEYDQLIGPLIEAVKDLKAANDNLRQTVEQQGQEINALKRMASETR